MAEATPPPAETTSAAANIAAETQTETPPANTPTGTTPANTTDEPTSAAADIANANNQPPPEEEKPVDLGKTTDEDYAKLVIPDVEGQEAEPDRSLITPMAQELREAGIQPSVMRKVAAAYSKAVDAAIKKDNAARAERMKTLTEECSKQLTDEDRKNFAAAYKDHIAGDEYLKNIVDHTELGSNAAFIKLIALAGATLRVEKSPRETASAGSGQQTDLDRRVFMATVPAHLR